MLPDFPRQATLTRTPLILLNSIIHARIVAPLVTTSSTNNTWHPSTQTVSRNSKASATLSARCPRSKPVCEEVFTTRLNTPDSTRTPKTLAIPMPIIKAWLKPRSFSRSGCNGTGITQSIPLSSCIRSPSIFPAHTPNSLLERYLIAYTNL